MRAVSKPVPSKPTALAVAGLLLLTVSWVFANPPGNAPDEPSHYVKAMGSAFGQLVPAHTAGLPSTTPGERYARSVTGTFTKIPAAYRVDPRWGCERFTHRSARCLEQPLAAHAKTVKQSGDTTAAYYPPAIPLLLGLAGRLGGNASAALYLGRLASALLCTVLLGIAITLVARGWALVGVLAAASPMVVFQASELSASGVELCAAVAHGSTIMALARGDRRGAVWLCYLVSGVPLAVARQLGPLWIVCDLALLAVLLGVRRAVALIVGLRGWRLAALLTVWAAAASTVLWDVLVVRPLRGSLSQIVVAIVPTATSLPDLRHQLVGVFGWLDTPLPEAVYPVVLFFYLALVVVAGAIASRRERLPLFALVLGAFWLAVLIDVSSLLPFDQGMQARYTMPLNSTALILAGAVVEARLAARRGRGAVAAPVAAAAGLTLLQVLAFASNSRQSAVGAGGTWDFASHALWSPPLGWWLWLATAVIAGLALGIGCCLRAAGACERGGVVTLYEPAL